MLSLKVSPSFREIGLAFKLMADGFKLQSQLERFAFSIEREAKKVTPVDTGRLRASIFTSIGSLKATVQPNTDYAFYVHEGTRRMRARPFMQIGLEIVKLRDMGKGNLSPFMVHLEKQIDQQLAKIRIG